MTRLTWPRRAPARSLSPADLGAAWQLVAVLLDYPTAVIVERRDALGAAASRLPEHVGAPLTSFLTQIDQQTLEDLQSSYVSTFDHRRQTCLYLTYFSCGDTRKRGVALVRIKQAYRRAGVALTEDELPDHLSVVLQFGATVDQDVAWRLLNEHRAGIEVLRLSLLDLASPWAHVVTALSRTLPDLGGDDETAVRRLIEIGPPIEEVGTEPYTIDPRLNPLPPVGALS